MLLRSTSASRRTARFCASRSLSGVFQRVLAIETSCDDTAAAVVGRDGTILSDVRQGQWAANLTYGGIKPSVARDLHKKNIEEVVSKALVEAGCTPRDVDAIAVTRGPGLEMSLRVGFQFARQLAYQFSKPCISVNHIEAHVILPRMTTPELEFPYLCLLASGGHTQIVLVKGIGRYIVLGDTLDSAAGTAFDKMGRSLKLQQEDGEMFGATLERYAMEGDPHRFYVKSPLLSKSNCNFSFSGLRTSIEQQAQAEFQVLKSRNLDETSPEWLQCQRDLSAAALLKVTDHFMRRANFAIAWSKIMAKPMRLPPGGIPLVFTGGVSCNKFIKAKLQSVCDFHNIDFVCPPKNLCNDNGVMIGWLAFEQLKRRSSHMLSMTEISVYNAEHDPVPVFAKWPLQAREERREFFVPKLRRNLKFPFVKHLKSMSLE